MKRQHLIIIIAVSLILLLVVVGILLYGFSQGAALPGFGARPEPTPTIEFKIPQIEVTPPPSLGDIAADIRVDYPELADALENPELGSVYKDFYLAYQQGGQQTALALARQRGILNDNNEIEMTLVLDTEETAPLIAELEQEGVIIKGSFRNKINIAIPVPLIETELQAEDPTLIINDISNLEHVIRLEFPQKASPKQGGGTLGQGVNVTQANRWHDEGVTGKGVKVGVLDVGFDGYEALLGNELPDNVTFKTFGDDDYTNNPHGTACAEIVHEMAPNAELVLAYYDGTDVAMGQAVEWLIEQEVDIISNSTGSNGFTPLNGTGFGAEIVDWAHDEGIFWVNAAGNEADSHYRGQFTDSNNDTLHEFSSDFNQFPFIPFGEGSQTNLILSWDDWDNADQDYDLILYDGEGNLLAKSEEPQSGEDGQYPVELIVYEFDDNEVYLLDIQNYDDAARGDATFDLFIEGGLMHPDLAVAERSLGSPADAHGSFSIGAVHWSDDILEVYSSHGPTADGRIKPDLSAPSVVDSASYAPDAFDGTSAATPHVSGAAALALEAFPDLSPDELGTFLQERAVDLGSPGPDNGFGVGRLSLGAAPPPPKPEEAPAEPEEAPNAPPATEEPPPPPKVELRPTSTPRAKPVVGLPEQIETGGQASAPSEEDEGIGGLIILIGLCLVCIAGLGVIVVVVGGIVMMRRK